MNHQTKEQKLEHFKGLTRLPKFAVPRRYDLSLVPNLELCTFSGYVTVDISVLESTRFLVLNSIDLVINESFYTDSSNHKLVPSEAVVDKDDETLVLVFNEALGVGNGVLEVKFSGVLNEHMKGFYKGTYVDGGARKNMAVTQFEPADARRCFPCWDEPALKATFKITIGSVPSELTALSNMPVSEEIIDGDFKTVSFEESPLMSTYLVAVVVGLFDYIEETTSDGIKVRAYCPTGKSDKGKLALSISVKSIELYRKYFSMPYTLPKLDMVAVPDFSCGAMENYGLITYREAELLHDDLHSAAANTQRLSIVVTHEVGHQWFGNLVTLEWWTHLWLNEGFATWVSYLATDSFFPEWRIWTQFLEVTAGGLRLDSLEQSHPVEVEVQNAILVAIAYSLAVIFSNTSTSTPPDDDPDFAFLFVMSLPIGRRRGTDSTSSSAASVFKLIPPSPDSLMEKELDPLDLHLLFFSPQLPAQMTQLLRYSISRYMSFTTLQELYTVCRYSIGKDIGLLSFSQRIVWESSVKLTVGLESRRRFFLYFYVL